jgi:tRNA G10  N-methylase Trm11
VKDKTPACALDEFRKRLQRNISNFRFIPEATFQICAANAQHLPLGDNTIDLIVTSPPYASNAIDYMRAHKFSLVWFGYSIDELSSYGKPKSPGLL